MNIRKRCQISSHLLHQFIDAFLLKTNDILLPIWIITISYDFAKFVQGKTTGRRQSLDARAHSPTIQFRVFVCKKTCIETLQSDPNNYFGISHKRRAGTHEFGWVPNSKLKKKQDRIDILVSKQKMSGTFSNWIRLFIYRRLKRNQFSNIFIRKSAKMTQSCVCDSTWIEV